MLGKNARHMFEIGIVQDELISLGFRQTKFSEFNLFNERNSLITSFHLDEIWLSTDVTKYLFKYSSPTWQQDVINKIKELICE